MRSTSNHSIAFLFAFACACAPARGPIDAAGEKVAIARVLDALNDAADKADETRYFALYTDDAVFLGTDGKERWDLTAFRAFAHPYFAKGKAWSFKSVRRAITISTDGNVAWFDESLSTPNLGPSRGSGVLVKNASGWKIAQYNLAIVIPNEKLDAVKAAIGP
jgi:uncharacterized protein (TIGR02246 family)